MDLEKAYEVLGNAFASLERVRKGLCPKCGAKRDDDICRNCGHRSIYVEPF